MFVAFCLNQARDVINFDRHCRVMHATYSRKDEELLMRCTTEALLPMQKEREARGNVM